MGWNETPCRQCLWELHSCRSFGVLRGIEANTLFLTLLNQFALRFEARLTLLTLDRVTNRRLDGNDLRVQPCTVEEVS